MEYLKILEDYSTFKEVSLSGRYITYANISPLITKWESLCKVEEIGFSENKLPIHLIKIGNGPKKIVMWSQMHGNESTTTKAIFDLLNYMNIGSSIGQQILTECTLYIVPMLNPDGAKLYTRENYNKIDLNRDAQNQSQKESIIFRNLITKIDPLIAFNLHGQRTIFSAGNEKKSAIVSFLSPASNPERTVTESRKIGMRIIAEMDKELQKIIPNSVGRYDDSFNINCTGDTLENENIPTILFEAGHYPNDYEREITRKLIFLSLVTSTHFIANNTLVNLKYEDYFTIPENKKYFNDIIVRNYSLNGEIVDISLQYKEMLKDDQLYFVPYVFNIQKNIPNFGHLEFDAKQNDIQIKAVDNNLKIDNEIVVFKINDKEFSVFPIKY